ncbi:hypothetical protein PV325_005679 [Microctonus aethiopoides]|nr:hypothetical protein PV325_005679 [Microctonus aethiopoides]
MVKITVDLIRKRSEHNEGEISTLEEISLHQENIDKIELIDKLSRNLKILLLQNNIIGKIENLNMLKKLEYLNLALNNIEVIENLEGLESLQKLDLTINFIGDLQNIKKLRRNEHLTQLFLTGNPCADYLGYRNYVIATLSQLKELDMKEIKRSDRITALQYYAKAEGDIIRGHRNYIKIREKQIDRDRIEKLKIVDVTNVDIENNKTDNENYNEEEENTKFWNGMSCHTPEDRIKIAERTIEIENKKNKSKNKINEGKIKYIPKLFSPDGRPYNLNQAKVSFTLNDEDDRENIILNVTVYRHLDTSLVNVDVQPHYVRVTIKEKILQLSLPCEVLTDKSVASRNVVTGNLIVTMPRLDPLQTVIKPQNHSNVTTNVKQTRQPMKKIVKVGAVKSVRELLEIGPPRDDLDFSKIYKTPKELEQIVEDKLQEKKIPDDFIDDPEVPPLE